MALPILGDRFATRKQRDQREFALSFQTGFVARALLGDKIKIEPNFHRAQYVVYFLDHRGLKVYAEQAESSPTRNQDLVDLAADLRAAGEAGFCRTVESGRRNDPDVAYRISTWVSAWWPARDITRCLTDAIGRLQLQPRS